MANYTEARLLRMLLLRMTSNEAMFEISGLVDQEIEKDFKFPLSGRVHAYAAMAYGIKLKPGERYIDSNGDLQENWGAELEPIFIIKGKLPKFMLAELNDAESTWYDYFATGGRFLSLMPLEQTVSPYQPVKVWMKGNNPDINSYVYTIVITGYFDDGTTQVIEQTPTIYRDMLYEFDAQPASGWVQHR